MKRRDTALVSREITIAVPTTAADVATLQRDAEADAPAVRAIICTTPDDYTFADAVLTDLVQKKDAVVAMRKQATVPLYQVVRTIESWFKPVVVALESGERHLKSEMGRYRLELDARELAAREAAAVAAETGDSAGMLDSINAANAIAAAPADARATVRYVWAVKRIAADLVPREWLVPDVARINALARETPGDADAPIVPGVVFEKVAQIGARR
jgi:hypothetical protein